MFLGRAMALLSVLVLSGWASGATAPANFTVPAFDPRLAGPAQGGAQRSALEQQLHRLRLPAGFQVEVLALVPGARHLAVHDNGRQVFVGTRNQTVWVVDLPQLPPGQAASAATAPARVTQLAPSLALRAPNGVCLGPDGALIIAERNRVLRLPDIAQALRTGQLAVQTLVAEGQLVPRDAESTGHGLRTCKINTAQQLFVSLGQPFNVQPADRIAAFEARGIGGVIRLDARTGNNRLVFARGMRNPVGLAIDPRDQSLWSTDNQTDHMGDDTPPGELNHLRVAGAHYGYPWYCGHVRVSDAVAGYALSAIPPPAGLVWPVAEFAAHAADLGLIFYPQRAATAVFPVQYRGGLFVAEHGSWNRTVPVGYRVVFVAVNADGQAAAPTPFLSGFLDTDSGEAFGRPVDVAPLDDGSLVVSDDQAGALYRVWYAGPAAMAGSASIGR